MKCYIYISLVMFYMRKGSSGGPECELEAPTVRDERDDSADGPDVLEDEVHQGTCGGSG